MRQPRQLHRNWLVSVQHWQKASWVQGDTLNIRGSGGGNIVTSGAQTYELTAFVRDNQNADPAPAPANDPGDNIVSRRFVIGINGS